MRERNCKASFAAYMAAIYFVFCNSVIDRDSIIISLLLRAPINAPLMNNNDKSVPQNWDFRLMAVCVFNNILIV